MELRFNEDSMKKVIEKYYMEYEDFDGKVITECNTGYVGYGMSEREDALVSIKIVGKLDVMGEKISMTRDVSSNDVLDIFKTVLGKSGYTVSDVSLDKGLKQTCEGYGMGERMVSKPYFNGIVVKTSEKQLVK